MTKPVNARMQPRSARSAAAGFTMLEVLVALLVISLGLLGLAGLQGVSLKNNVSAAQRTIATQLAYDISDRMRANLFSVYSYAYNYSNYSTTPAGTQTTACTSSAGCTSAQLALEDIYEWNQQICAQLPQASASCAVANGPWGVVCIDSTPNDGTPAAPACDNIGAGGQAVVASTVAPQSYVVKIWWLEDRNDPNLPTKLWWTNFQP
jgi:type IV pilus assembly protein PilV